MLPAAEHAAVTALQTDAQTMIVADTPVLIVLQGVQLLLDGVTSYLPCPLDGDSYALDAARDEEQVRLLKSRSGALPAASCLLLLLLPAGS